MMREVDMLAPPRGGLVRTARAVRGVVARGSVTVASMLALGVGLGAGTGLGDLARDVFGPAPAEAQGVPTFDTAQLTQLIAQVDHMARDMTVQLDQVATMKRELETQVKQLTNLDAQLDALIEQTGLGDLFATVEEFRQLEGVLSNPLDGLDAIMSGDFAGGFSGPRATDAADALTAVLAPVGFDTATMGALSGSTEPRDQNIARQAGAAGLLSAMAQESHVEAGASLGRLEDMVDLIDDQGSLKAAVDLNTRVTAELGIILTQIWRLEAAQGVSVGQLGVVDASTLAAERKFLSMTVSP